MTYCMTETSPALRNLTDDEANFVYNVEVLGLPAKRPRSWRGCARRKSRRRISSRHANC